MRDFSHFDLLRLSESYRSVGEGDDAASGMNFADEDFMPDLPLSVTTDTKASYHGIASYRK